MNILLTGCSKGVGLSTLELLLYEGHTVYGISRTFTSRLEELKVKYEGQFFWMKYDLSDVTNILGLFKEFIGFKTRLDGIVNNAATAYDDIVTNLNVERLEQMYRTNVFGPMLMVKYAIRHMLLHNVSGSIVHLSSISVHTGYKGLAMYASTKGALEAFSKNTAREWGERGVRSNCIVAGFMETGMSSTLSDSQKHRIYQRTSLKQATDVLSVAEMIAFLLSDKSKSITGQNLFVDSGTI